MERKNRRYCGIDLGKKNMEVRFLKENEKTIAWNCKTDAIGRHKLYSKIRKDDLVGIEACSLAFVIAKEIISKIGAEVIVLNPSKLAIIYASTKKTDSEDAMKIARLLQRNPIEELPGVPIPSDEEMKNRAIVKELGYTKKERTRNINRLHSIYVSSGITTLKKSNLKTHKNRVLEIKLLKGRWMIAAQRLMNMIDLLESHIKELENEQTEALRENELTHYVMSIPGVGPQTALTFLGYVGDGSRFENEREIGNYSGLVPKVDISGSIVKYGHITKQGCNPLRRVVIQAAWALIRNPQNGKLAQKYREFRTRMGAKKAIVAIARRLVVLMWTLVKNRTYYHNFGKDYLKDKMEKYKLLKNVGSVA